MLKCRTALPILVAGFVVVAANLSFAADWPRFRGPNGSGIAEDKTIPVKWTTNDQIWKVELPGSGNSSPIVWKGQIYTQAASKDGTERMLICLDAKDGSTKWVQKVKGILPPKKSVHENNTLASASPGVDADHVYAVQWDGAKQVLYAYTHDGKPAWSHDFGTFVAQHGAGASPIPYGGKVYFNNDIDKKAELFCLDGKTGKVVWSAPRKANTASYAAPLVRMLEDGKTAELVVVTAGGMTAYHVETGAKHWNLDWKFKEKVLRTVGSPIYDHGMVFATAGDSPAGPRQMIAVRPGDKTPKVVWEIHKDIPYMSTVVSHGKHLYYVTDKNFAGCFEAETGKRVWHERLGEADFSSSPVLIDGKIYVANHGGEVFVLAANPERPEVLARNSLNERIQATPAVSDERLYIRGQKHLFCIGKR